MSNQRVRLVTIFFLREVEVITGLRVFLDMLMESLGS